MDGILWWNSKAITDAGIWSALPNVSMYDHSYCTKPLGFETAGESIRD